ncbi:MAG: ADP-ribosylglycohydrolase family protein [Clostridia bacterium]|nr:ADP-ribosylglycohydrolase family protein [Clostridia bacterium]
MKIAKQIIENGIYGLAVGDALGVPYEFQQRARIAAAPCVDMIGFGTFEKPAGTWSDDTSMTLASLDGLSEMRKDSDYTTVMNKFVAWLNCGDYTVDGVFDVGRTCMDAIMKYARGITPLECGGRGEFANGNGSLMRILPSVLYALAKGLGDDFLDNMSSLTHGHAISKAACRIYARVVKAIIEKGDKAIMLAAADNQGQEVFNRLKAANFYKLPESEIKSSGYVVDTLEAALWCFFNTGNYKDCVLKAVNLGQDTDTVAAIAGSLAGLYYGKESIPAAWVETLRGKELIDGLIEKFYNRVRGKDGV